MDVSVLAAIWLEARAAETQAAEKRRAIEQQLLSALAPDLADWPNAPVVATVEQVEQVREFIVGDYKIAIAARVERQANGAFLHSLAYQKGVLPYLDIAFTWLPELRLKAWFALPAQVRRALAPAVSIRMARPIVKVEKQGG